jgi:predicted RNA-binding Zn ribbon-like protein
MVHPLTPVFIADALALDFLNTAAAPLHEKADCLGTGAALLDWLERAALVPQATIDQLREQIKPEVLDKVAGKARELREWFRHFVLERKGRSLTVEDLEAAEQLNQILSIDNCFTALVAKDDGGTSPLQLQIVRRCRSPDSLLMPIAELLARFLCEENFDGVKGCEGPGCELLFADHTRQRGRRWCSMDLCGNRAKQAAHRHRTKGKP